MPVAANSPDYENEKKKKTCLLKKTVFVSGIIANVQLPNFVF